MSSASGSTAAVPVVVAPPVPNPTFINVAAHTHTHGLIGLGLTEADLQFMKEEEQRLVERSALELEAQSHEESQPFDMFLASPSDFEREGRVAAARGVGVGCRAHREALLEEEDPHLAGNWDDGEGYYRPRIGELIGDRFQTQGVVGKGVFSIVIKC